MSDFIHLHVHSHYSLLNALPKIPELVKRAKKNNMPALALTDAGNMYGAIEFYKTCKKNEIKPIIGVDFYVALRTRHDKQPGVDNRRYRLVLLAKNENGYKNLIKMVTESNLTGFYYRPRIDDELMKEFSEDVIAILPSFSSEISTAIKNHNLEKAEERIAFYKSVYKDDLYIELTHHPEIDGHQDLMKDLQEFAEKHSIPVVAGHDIYYLEPSDKKARDTLMSVGGTNFKGGFDEEEDFSFASTKDIEKFFKKNPEAIANTKKIADQCNLELTLGEWVFPLFPIPEGTTYDEEFRRTVYEGLEKKGIQETPTVKERIEYELEVIKGKGFSPYFLIVGDLLREAKERDILTTIRGSVAGSLVTYLVGITKINPLEYKLPFNRFLNPERPTAPDIDMDFADDRRDEMIQYAKDKYGEEKVAQIGTFGTMAARGSVRDTTRALGYPYDLGDQIAKLIPMGSQGFPMTIERALDMVDDLKKLYRSDARVSEIIDMAKKIEGCARHISVHAAGVVISPSAVTDYVPIQIDQKSGKYVTQYNMHAVEDAGLIKFDFLGIKNLAILADAIKRVKWRHNVDVDIENIPLDDPKTFDLLSKGETMGLFQLNGAGMTRFLKELRPTTIHDINAMVALYRPGPMEMIPEYIKRKYNPRLITYLDPRMKDILDMSYGVITYQDDVMMIAIELAGYSWLEADKLRKAMGKKIPELMEEQKKKLFSGLAEHGMNDKKIDELWSLIEPFAAYGFNKAHAASYGRVAYQTAYMKANYPIEYLAAIMTADSGDVEKIAEIVAEAKRMGIEILPPDINESFGTFTIVEDEGTEKIRFGLYTIKNFGEGIADVVIEERKKNGKFKSIADLLERVQDRNLNKKTLEALIKCGALDDFEARSTLLANVEGLLQYAKEQAAKPKNQDSLFGGLSSAQSVTSLSLQEAEPLDFKQKLDWEKELLGLYISGHPLDPYKDKLMNREQTIDKLLKSNRRGITVVAAGIIDELKTIRTKKNDEMAFVKLSDFTGTMEVVVFPKVFEDYKTNLKADACIAIKGRTSERNGEISFVADAVKSL